MWVQSSEEEAEWDSSNQAKLQLGCQWANQQERIEEPRQAKRCRKVVEYPTKKKSVSSGKKKCCLGGRHSKTDTHQNNINHFDCGSICGFYPGVICSCDIFMCNKCSTVSSQPQTPNAALPISPTCTYVPN